MTPMMKRRWRTITVDYDGKDMPKIVWNRENPNLTPATAFESMRDGRNALTTYCILIQNIGTHMRGVGGGCMHPL
jgi:hypothetical protein